MCKILHIKILIIIFILNVSCNHTMIDKNSEVRTSDTTLHINEIFKIDTLDKGDFAPYVIPNIVSMDEFEHSEYMLMVRASRHSFTGEKIPIFTYAFLGENTNDFEEGNEIYNKLDSKYSKQYPHIDLPESYYDAQDDKQVEALNDYFFKRSIIFVSSDGEKVLCHSLLFGGILMHTGFDGMPVEREAWNGVTEIYDGKELIYRNMYKDDDPNQSAPFIYDFFINRSVFDINGFILDNDVIINYVAHTVKNVNKDDSYILHIPNTTNKFLKRTVSRNEISMHSLLDGNRLVSINIPDNLIISQLTDEERFVVLFELKAPGYGDDLEGFHTVENIYSNGVYIMDIDGSNARYLGNYMFNPNISPDGKYIAYTGLSGTDHQEYSDEFNNLAEMKDGFYIKNIETNQTIFYPVEGANEYNIVSWVSKKGLANLLD